MNNYDVQLTKKVIYIFKKSFYLRKRFDNIVERKFKTDAFQV